MPPRPPLLPIVFGSHEPQSLYGNIEEFVFLSDLLENTLEIDANYTIAPGTYVDSIEITMDSEDLSLHYTATVTALTGLITIPSDASEIIGTSADLDYLISIAVTEMPDAVMQVGVKVNGTEQTFLQYGTDEDSGKDTYKTVYASMDPADSSFDFRGVGLVAYDSGERFAYVFSIGSEQDGDFTYRNSWYSNGDGGSGPTHLHCIIGGGDKDTEFAMKYHHYQPANATVIDSTLLSQQLFGANFTEGTGLITDFDEFIEDSLFYDYDLIPSAALVNPYE